MLGAETMSTIFQFFHLVHKPKETISKWKDNMFLSIRWFPPSYGRYLYDKSNHFTYLVIQVNKLWFMHSKCCEQCDFTLLIIMLKHLPSFLNATPFVTKSCVFFLCNCEQFQHGWQHDVFKSRVLGSAHMQQCDEMRQSARAAASSPCLLADRKLSHKIYYSTCYSELCRCCFKFIKTTLLCVIISW